MVSLHSPRRVHGLENGETDEELDKLIAKQRKNLPAWWKEDEDIEYRDAKEIRIPGIRVIRLLTRTRGAR